MGFRFQLEHANWLAHVISQTGTTPTLEHSSDSRHAIRRFIESMDDNFYGSHMHRRELRNRLRDALEEIVHEGREDSLAALRIVSDFFRNTPWCALIIPGLDDYEFDKYLTSRDLLRDLVSIRPGDNGLILQLDEPPSSEINLEHVFPAFKVALANATAWPGVLLWTPESNACFLQLPHSIARARDSLEWLFSHLATMPGIPDLELLRSQYHSKFDHQRELQNRPLRILHLSDIHLGSHVARRRMSRVKRLISLVANELGNAHPLVPIVTGDLMDSPEEGNLDDVMSFVEFLHGVGTHEPVFVLGNHDVRKDGWLSPNFQHALDLEKRRFTWFPESGIGMLAVNSVRGGNIAQGEIGEREFLTMGDTLDRHKDGGTIIALVHHHPIPVEIPYWYKKTWYERLLGGALEKTEELQDAELFLQWLRKRKIRAVLHGHKHIPRVEEQQQLAIIGCGSSVGKVETEAKGQTYISMNIVTFDQLSNQFSVRLRAERIPGAGFDADASHERMFRFKIRS